MKRALVTGAGGFIGGHLVQYLKGQGYYVIGVDIKRPEFRKLDCNDFWVLDLRNGFRGIGLQKYQIDEIYHLAADMGGMGFIHEQEIDILRNNTLINQSVIYDAINAGVSRFFFSSSVCIYRDMQPGETKLTEEDAYPAIPDNEYGWEKLFAERVFMTYARHSPTQVRIARFQNCYGPYGTYKGGREKAPAAICRKVAEAPDGGSIDIWGDGTALRNFVYIDDLVRGIYQLMQSPVASPANIGTEEIASINELAEMIIKISGKHLTINHIDGPVGVQARYFDHDRMHRIGWKPIYCLEDGLRHTYEWIAAQVDKDKAR